MSAMKGSAPRRLLNKVPGSNPQSAASLLIRRNRRFAIMNGAGHFFDHRLLHIPHAVESMESDVRTGWTTEQQGAGSSLIDGEASRWLRMALAPIAHVDEHVIKGDFRAPPSHCRYFSCI